MKRRPKLAIKEFLSPGGRTFTLAKGDSYPPRFEGDANWHYLWFIHLNTVVVGKLFLSATYKEPWSATCRELCWAGGLPPRGLGFDVSAFGKPEEALQAWARSADQVLDYREGKRVPNIYDKRGYSRL